MHSGGLQQARAVGQLVGLAAYESGRAEPVERAHKKDPVAGHRQVDRNQILYLDVEGGPRPFVFWAFERFDGFGISELSCAQGIRTR